MTTPSNTTLIILATEMSAPDSQVAATPRRIAVEGLRSGADIKSFRRRLIKIICPDASPAAVDVYFKGVERGQCADGVSSKQKFERRVRDCLDLKQPLAINYRLRPKVVGDDAESKASTEVSSTQDQVTALTKENAELKAQLAAATTKTPPTAQCLKSTAGGIAQTMASFLAAYNTLMSEPGTAPIIPAVRDESKSQPGDATIHPDILCDGPCDSQVKGIRYKCATCPDFDMCGPCYHSDRQAHLDAFGQDHLFLAIHEPRRFNGRQMQRAKDYAKGSHVVASGDEEKKAETPAETAMPGEYSAAAAAPAAPRPRAVVDIIDEPIPTTSDLDWAEKASFSSVVAAAVNEAGDKSAAVIKGIVDILHDSGALEAVAGVSQADDIVLDLDRITRAHLDKVKSFLGVREEGDKGAAEKGEMPAAVEEKQAEPSKAADAQIEANVTQSAATAAAKPTIAPPSLAPPLKHYDCEVRAVEGGWLLRNTGTRVWTTRQGMYGRIKLDLVYAGPGWADQPSAYLDMSQPVAPGCTHFVARPAQVLDEAYFKLAVERLRGPPERFGEQLHLTVDAPRAATTTSTPSPASLSSSSMLTIPAAPEARDEGVEDAVSDVAPSSTHASESLHSPSLSSVHSSDDDDVDDEAFEIVDRATDEESVA